MEVCASKKRSLGVSEGKPCSPMRLELRMRGNVSHIGSRSDQRGVDGFREVHARLLMEDDDRPCVWEVGVIVSLFLSCEESLSRYERCCACHCAGALLHLVSLRKYASNGFLPTCFRLTGYGRILYTYSVPDQPRQHVVDRAHQRESCSQLSLLWPVDKERERQLGTRVYR